MGGEGKEGGSTVYRCVARRERCVKVPSVLEYQFIVIDLIP